MSTVTMDETLAMLQSAQRDLVEATEAILTHNISLSAHEDIRELIRKILDSDTVYTKDEIKQLVTTGIKEHIEKSFTEAHPGFEEFNTELQVIIETIRGELEGIKNRLDGEEAAAGRTDLQKMLQAIEDKYFPILDNLQKAFEKADSDGNTVLAEEYKNTISKTLDEKKNELMKAYLEWQQSKY